MKVGSLKEYRESVADAEMIHEYLRVDHTKTLRELFLALGRLTLGDNFDCFITEITIPAGAELPIRNALKSGDIPTSWIRLRGGDGSQNVVDGDTAWDRSYLYLKNVGATVATLKIAFLR